MTRAYKKQHLVSRVLLDRFAAGQGKKRRIEAFDLVTHQTRLVRPNTVGFEKDFIRRDPQASESIWQAIEDRIGGVFTALEDQSLLRDSEAVESVREMIAVHWARSLMLKAVWRAAQHRTFSSRRAILLRDPEKLRQVFRDLTGLEPAGPQALEWAADRVYEAVANLMKEEDVFRERVHDNYQRMRSFAQNHPLQIGYTSDQFIIGDAPVLALKAGFRGVGPLQGVPLDEADTVVLPLGPNHVAALGGESGFFQVPDHGVQMLNEGQVAHTFYAVFYRPGAAKENLIVRVLNPRGGNPA